MKTCQFLQIILTGLTVGPVGLRAASRPTVDFDQPAVPAITSLSPSIVVVGRSAITLTVNGSGFGRNAVVRWNGADRPTTYLSDSQLQAAVPASDLDALGTAQVVVFVPGGQGGVSNPLILTVGNPVPSISSLAPSSGIAGAEPFTLNVSGAFVQGAHIRWNGVGRATSFANGRLTAVIASAELVAGTAQVTIFNPAPGGGPSAPRPFSVVHASPVISALVPTKATQGAAAFTLTVDGQNFVRSSSTVLWNSAQRATKFVSPTRLQASISSADVANSGTATVTVVTTVAQSVRTSAASSFVIEFTGQVIVGAPPAPPPAPLGEERLPLRGFFDNDLSSEMTMDCKLFGRDFVMVGISGKHGLGIDWMNVLCSRFRANGTIETAVAPTPGLGGGPSGVGGTPMPERRCAAGQVVTGMRGSNVAAYDQVRSIELRCQPIGATGLAAGTTTVLAVAGTPHSASWGMDGCSGGRSARAIRAQKEVMYGTGVPNLFAPRGIAAVQLICEQPRPL